jgi:isopenicillin-N N-acyltransferase-like protein
MEVEHLVYLNVRDDLAAIRHIVDPGNVQHATLPLPPQHAIESTSAFFSHHKTEDYAPVLAHSWSENKRIHDDDEFMVLLEIQYCDHEDVADMVILVEAGMISGSGMNSQGLVVTGNTMFSSADHVPGFGGNTKYFPMTCLERYLLEWAKVDNVENILSDVDRHASKHVLLADHKGDSISLELGPNEHTFAHNGDFGSEVKLHTNHFHSWEYWRSRYNITCRYRGDPSPYRLHRLGQIIEFAYDERVSPFVVKAMFSDHERGASGMCQHGDENDNNGNKTVAFVMYDTFRKVVSVCKGPPCRGTMVHFAVRQSKPLTNLPAAPNPGLPPAPAPQPQAARVAPMIDMNPEIAKAVAAMCEMDVEMEMEMHSAAAASKRQLRHNTPESDIDSKRRRLNNTPVSDGGRDVI